MAKQPAPARQHDPAKMATIKLQLPHCRCFANEDGTFEMFILDPDSGTYSPPVPCTQEMCEQCIKSRVVPIGT